MTFLPAMRPPASRLVSVIAAAALTAAACGSSDRPELASDREQPTSTPTTAPADEPADAPATEPADTEPPDSEPADTEPADTESPDEPADTDPAPLDDGVPASLDEVAVALREVAELSSPIAMAFVPGSGELFVAEQDGLVWGLSPNEAGGLDVSGEPVIDLTDATEASREQGLLGLAISPDGSHIYAVYSTDTGANRLVEYAMDGDVPDPGSQREVMVVEQPAANHNGGNIVFGPDGFLYYGLGDGGGSGDQFQTGQDASNVLGTILRIDPAGDGDNAYLVPADNPFIGRDGRDEVWLYGVRNPWRFSFDGATGNLWVADVGQNAIEEITIVSPETGLTGPNLGWSLVEGSQPFNGSAPPDHVGPVFEYTHDEGCSITGGYVYRGRQIPGLAGAFVFADYCASQIRAVAADADGTFLDERTLAVGLPEQSVVSFGEGPDGELYVLTSGGEIYGIVPV